LAEVLGQDHLLGPSGILTAMVSSGRFRSGLLWGPPGTGKTTIAGLLAAEGDAKFVALSATGSGVKDLRLVLEQAATDLAHYQVRTMVFIDEIHRFSKSQQDVLLPGVERGEIVLIGATTENPFFEVNAALLSRMTVWRLQSLDAEGLVSILRRGLEVLEASASAEALQEIAGLCQGDGRAALGLLEGSWAFTQMRESGEISQEDVLAAGPELVAQHGRDAHYDLLSAFIKSLRGSADQAALYWMARLLQAGESPRLLARRMVIMASEDIGLADPTALLAATAAAQAVEFVGLPECQLNLAQVVLHLCRSPKSHEASTMLGLAQADAAESGGAAVPEFLRDGHYRAAGSIGHGVGYVSPHVDPDAHRVEDYLPEHARPKP
jgi:putative ATPase